MRLTYGGQFFSYEQEGSGPTPVLFLHGWGTSLTGFRVISRLLGKNYTSYCLDIPGFGETPLPVAALHVAEIAQLVATFTKALRLGPAIFVGHGLSGKIMVRAAARFPERVRGLVLVDVVGPAQNRWLDMANHIVASRDRLWRWPGFFEYRQRAKARMVQAIGFQDYTLARFMSQSLDLLLADDSMAAAALIIRPTALLWGRNDSRGHIADGRRYWRAIRGSQWRLLSGLGHLDVGRDPERFSQALLTVLG